ncbi:MAG: S8 family serine peptidase [Anaerolineae bacterium]|nr:S8 family serine peptidase [Anaerolineae bacterium]
MRRRRSWLFSTLLTVAILFNSVSFASAWESTPGSIPPGFASENGEYVPGEVVVGLDRAASEEGVRRATQSLGAQSMAGSIKGRFQLYRFASDAEAERAIAALQRLPGVVHVFRNRRVSVPELPTPPGDKRDIQRLPSPSAGSPQAAVTPPQEDVDQAESAAQGDPEPEVVADHFRYTPGPSGTAIPLRTSNDPARGWQWHLDKIKDNLTALRLEPAPLIAIVDTGVDYNHPDLKGKVLSGRDFVGNDNDPLDENGHGTHLAGIAAAWADNGQGGTGVSPTSNILAVRVLDGDGRGSLFAILAGLDYATEYPEVRIINLSLDVYVPCQGPEYAVMREAIRSAAKNGKIVVVAAGNESDVPILNDLYRSGTVHACPIPASIPEAFTVAATDENDQRAYFSNYSLPPDYVHRGAGGFSFVDVAAPGWNILSAFAGQGYASRSGTSVAAPIVAGTAARVWAQFPGLTNAEVQTRLLSTGLELHSSQGFPVPVPRVDLRRALAVHTTGIQGQVVNPMNGLPLHDVMIQVRANSSVVAGVRTNAAGFYTLAGLEPGVNYTLLATRPDLIAVSIRATTLSGVIREGYNLHPVSRRHSIGPAEPNWHLALAWHDTQPGLSEWRLGYVNANPAILPWQRTAGQEMNLYLKTPGAGILSYADPGDLDHEPFARITRDSFADAVATEGAIIRRQAAGAYCVSVHLDPRDFGWGEFASSGATLRLHKGRTLYRTVRVSEAITGTGTSWWSVLRLEGDTVSVINELQHYPCWGSPDDDIPGIPYPSNSRAQGDLGIDLDRADVYGVPLRQGENYRFRLSGSATTDFDLYLFGPDAASIYGAIPLVQSDRPGSTECFGFKPPADGIYYLLAWAFAGKGSYVIEVSRVGGCPTPPRGPANRPLPHFFS